MKMNEKDDRQARFDEGDETLCPGFRVKVKYKPGNFIPVPYNFSDDSNRSEWLETVVKVALGVLLGFWLWA